MATKFKNEYFKDGELLFGVFYPTRYIIAVFDNRAQAEQAVAELKQHGCEARHATPQEALERAQEYLQQHSLVQHLQAAIASDEKAAMQQYMAQAKQGRHFVDVYVPEESKVGQVEAILEAHGAYDLHYYGEWDLVNLSSNEPPRGTGLSSSEAAG
jgi:pantoate kinase